MICDTRYDEIRWNEIWDKRWCMRWDKILY